MARPPDDCMAALAAKQHNAFTRDEALAQGFLPGVIDRRVQTGRWGLIEPGVYFVSGSPSTWDQKAMAAVLATGPAAMASHLAAAALWGMLESRPERFDVTVPHGRHHARLGWRVTHQARNLRRADVKTVRGIPVTSPNRTLIDLAGVLSPDQLEAALDTAVALGLVSIARLERYIDERRLGRNRGVGRLRALLHDRAKGVPEGELERRFLRLIRGLGIPEPIRQQRSGRRRIDFAYPEQRIMIELDSWVHHRTPSQQRSDNRRQNELVLRGWQPLRFTWYDVEPDSPMLATLKQLHAQRSQTLAERAGP
ncbi:MAG: type IV toxin-antitoxin system AbiEi family antitoxin [Actinomycetota bacterium]